jgi:HNH endonuclease
MSSEKSQDKTRLLQEIGAYTALSLFLFGVCNLAFSKRIKADVRDEQNNICANCGEQTNKLEIHHIHPQSQGGSDNRDNAVGLCGPKYNDCHQCVDLNALEDHIYWDGTPISLDEVRQRQQEHHSRKPKNGKRR